MTEQDKKQLKSEIDHIFKSGANEVRVFDMVQNFIDRRYGSILKYEWLTDDDMKFAIELRHESKWDAVKWLADKARPHSQTPLRTAIEILDAY